MKIIKALVKVITKPINMLPVQNKIVFESARKMSDNSKYFYESLPKDVKKKYKVFWLTPNSSSDFGGNSISNIQIYSGDNILRSIVSRMKIIYHTSTCRYHIFSYGNFALHKPKRNQYFVNLTHGTPLKDTRGLFSSYEMSNYIITTSDFASSLYEKSIDGGREQMKSLGFPRNDLLFRTNSAINKLYDKYSKTIVWLPTFRRVAESDRNDSGNVTKNDLPIFKDNESIQRLEEVLKRNNILLIVKPHPAQDLNYYPTFKSPNIIVHTNETLKENSIELYELLAYSDSLITDYSSVYLDYLLTDKPIAFTVDDIESYSSNLGFLVNDPTQYMPGTKMSNPNDFFNFIADITSDIDDHANERKKIKHLFHDYNDGCASERILELIFNER